jgi:hypothetical protein
MEKTMTPVDRLVEVLRRDHLDVYVKLASGDGIENIKKEEKEHMHEAYLAGFTDAYTFNLERDFEEYYSKKY